jgi:hypothetical protein
MPIEFPPPLSGSGPNVQVLDPGGAPNTIIQRGDTITIATEFAVNQPGASLLGGDWQMRAYVESIGPGQEIQVGTATLPVSAGVPAVGPARLVYSLSVPVNSTLLSAENNNNSGVYKLVVVITHSNFGGPTVLAGFSEGPVIQVREP